MKNKLIHNIKLIVLVSRLTGVRKKKLRIFYSVFLSNLIVGLDIIIIYYFASFFSNTENTFYLIKLILNFEYLLPLFIVLRYLIVVIEKLNIKSLQVLVSENIKNYIIKDIYEKGNYSISDATYYVTQLTDHISYFYGALATTLSSVIQLLVYLAFLTIADFKVLIFFTLLGLVLYLPSIFLLRQGRIQMDKNFNFGIKINEKTQNLIQNLFLFKILNTFENEYKNFRLDTKEYSRTSLKNYLFGTINAITPNLFTTLLISLIISVFKIVNNLTLEFIGVILRLVQTLGNVNNGLNMLINSHVHLEKISEIINNQKSNKVSIKLNKKIINSVELKNISFKYFGSNEYLFKNLNINFQEYSHNILLGPNGSGKSSLLGLIAGVFEPTEGVIELKSDKIGYVGVNPLIIKGTLKMNLLYGNKKIIIDETLVELCNRFQLFADKNDLDLNREITNSSMSSGQFQKVAFIRALLSDIDLLLLDESTSNLDEVSRKLVYKELKREKLTIINSTHNTHGLDFDFVYKLKNENGLTTIQKAQ